LSLVAQHNSISGSLISSRRSHHRDSRRAKEPEHYGSITFLLTGAAGYGFIARESVTMIFSFTSAMF
jgi:hypothetical protein